jgi:hypothetical protein
MRGGAAVKSLNGPHVWALAATLWAPVAVAAPRTIDDCEAIKEASAYNLCLASFGPTRGQHGATYPGVASEGAKGAPDRRDAPRAAAHGPSAQVARSHNGRIRMVFTPGRW